MNATATTVTQAPHAPRLVDCIGKVFIVAYKESTELLEAALIREGFPCEVLRQKHAPDYKDYSPSYLCLLNHRRAWEKAVRENQPTLVVEADFVPVLEFGKRPPPFPHERSDMGIAWLYTCAPQIYSVSEEGHAQGFSTAMVAYILTPQSARHLIELPERVREKLGATTYSPWDSEIEEFLRKKKLKNYVPFRNYGEHGGLPNPEHHRYGLSKTHRADVLYGKLAFTPNYAKNRRLALFSVRFQARLKGIARLALGKFLRIPVLRGSSFPKRLLSFAIGRQLTLRV
jgi:GR25 family glycosyltransferase involved in LPS biosynthesis